MKLYCTMVRDADGNEIALFETDGQAREFCRITGITGQTVSISRTGFTTLNAARLTLTTIRTFKKEGHAMGKSPADIVIDRFLILECDTVSIAAAMKRADNGDRITQSVEKRNIVHLIPFFEESVDRMNEMLVKHFDEAAAAVIALIIGTYISNIIDTYEVNAGVRAAIVALIRKYIK